MSCRIGYLLLGSSRALTTNATNDPIVESHAWRKPKMAGYTYVLGQKVSKGGKMTKGSTWRLVAQKGKKRAFAGTLLTTFNLGHRRIAVFSVPKD